MADTDVPTSKQEGLKELGQRHLVNRGVPSAASFHWGLCMARSSQHKRSRRRKRHPCFQGRKVQLISATAKGHPLLSFLKTPQEESISRLLKSLLKLRKFFQRSATRTSVVCNSDKPGGSF